jgi:uncharacterized peroxidase-related enzyme
MAWISVVDEERAEGELAAIYEEIRRSRGSVANVYKIHSLLPATMAAHLAFYLSLLYGKSPLARYQRELIATVVSATNACGYCVTHHSEALKKHLKDETVVEQVGRDHVQADLGAQDRAMLDYAAKLTRSPDAVAREDIDALRRAGFSDAAILSINLIASYFNFVNRVVSGLGVPLEPNASRVYKY